MITDSIIIMAAGLSSRMKKNLTSSKINHNQKIIADTKSKSLISFGIKSKPFINFLISNIYDSGFRNIYLVVPENSNDFQNYFFKSSESYVGCEIKFATQAVPKKRKKPLGTSDAVFQAMEQFPELKSKPFCVCNGDNLYSIKSFKKIRLSKFDYAFIAYEREGLKFDEKKVSSFSVTKLDSKNRLIDIIEKPTIGKRHFKLVKGDKIRVNMNLLKFAAESSYYFFESCPINQRRDEKEISDVILSIVRSNENHFYGISISEHVPDLTSKNDIQFVEKFLK